MVVSIILSVVIPLMLLIVLIGGVAFAVQAIKNKDSLKEVFGFQMLLKLYTYIILFISLILMVVGTGMMINSALSHLFGYAFSYQVNYYYDAVPVKGETPYDYQMPSDTSQEIMIIDGQKYTYNKTTQQRQALNGVVLLITSTIIFAIHAFILKELRKNEDEYESLDKSYIVLNLLLYSIASIVSLPMSIYGAVDYYFNSGYDFNDYSRNIPGPAIAIALVCIPIWILFIKKTLNIYLKEKHEKK